MAELIVYKGSKRITITPSCDTHYLYRIGPGQVEGGDFIELNDRHRLNELAEEIRDDYCRWIYSLNELFLQAKLKFDDLSCPSLNEQVLLHGFKQADFSCHDICKIS